jgi:hypothetical protein
MSSASGNSLAIVIEAFMCIACRWCGEVGKGAVSVLSMNKKINNT